MTGCALVVAGDVGSGFDRCLHGTDTNRACMTGGAVRGNELVVIDARSGLPDGGSMTGLTRVRRCDMDTQRLAGRSGTVMARRTTASDVGMVHPRCRSPDHRAVASIAGIG